MKWSSAILTLLGLLAMYPADAQSIRGKMTPLSSERANALDGKSRDNTGTKLEGSTSRHSMRRTERRLQPVLRTDSQAYYAHVERRNGWIEGRGKAISVKETTILPSYFRLSHPNGHGHWQKVESLRRGKPCTSTALAPYWDCPYPGLTQKAEEWMKQSRTATEWHQTAGPDGEELLEERACNEHHAVVFTTLYTSLDDNSVNLAFTDGRGLPIDVNPQGREMAFDQVNGTAVDTTYDNTYGTTVHILRDHAGRDSLVSLCDGNGYLKSRADGVTALKFVRDSLGRTVYELSLNICDAPVLRRSGFCGWHSLYEGDSPVPVHREKVNTNLAPMGLSEE